jgi:hypothetical protein
MIALLKLAWPYLLAATVGAFLAGVGVHLWNAGTIADLRIEAARTTQAAAETRAAAAEENLRLAQEAATRNEALRNEYDAKRAAADAAARDLSGRLFAALSSPARQGGVPASGGGSDPALAAAFASRTGELERAFAKYDKECINDAAQLATLIAQLKPQLQ